MLPAAVRPLFWDVDSTTFDPAAYPTYTVERVLEFGDESAVRWLRGAFAADAIRSVIRSSRHLSPRSANFWALVFGVPPGAVRTLQGSSSILEPR